MAGGRGTRIGPPWFAANEALAFVLEIAAVVALGWWGFAVGGGAMRILAGLGLPAVAIALWWMFAAPRARLRPPLPGVLAVKALVLLGGAAAVYGLGHPTLASVFAVIVVANTAVAEASRARFDHP